jgi:hypothetical protein
MEGTFDKYPNIEIVADAMDPVYRVKIMECVRDGRLVRFEKTELRVPRKTLESFVANLVGATMQRGK